MLTSAKIAILIPCFNEGLTVGRVIRDFRAQLPQADIYVFDNNSTDNTIEVARQEGAIIYREKRQGKGNVLDSMLRKIDADYYILVDGDDTYPAEYINQLLCPLIDDQADMVVGQRLLLFEETAFRKFHVFGNRIISRLINAIFSSDLHDPMSGFRAFNSDVAESLPVLARGFDVETEITLQLLYRNFVIKEIAIPYRARPEGSKSKLSTFEDGALVLIKILTILRSYKPLAFFGGLALISGIAGLVLGGVVVYEYMQTHLIYRVPMAILAVGLILLASMLASIGIILNAINFRLLEINKALSRQIFKSRL